MHAACWVTSSWHENIERINNIHISVGEGRFYKLSVSELDTIIRLEKLREEGMAYLRLFEHRNAEREAIKLRNKSQSRRMQAVRAAKQAKKTK
jgi:predicted DNA-binding WGR domain protein